MKSKCIGILVCAMLMTTFFAAAKGTETVTPMLKQNQQTTTTSFDNVSTPVWTVGDYWNYKLETFVVDVNLEGYLVHLALWTDKISLNVVGDTGDSYNLAINAIINGTGYTYMDLGDGPINITVELKETQLTGAILFNKSDLGIKHIEATLDGKIKFDVIQNPYIPIEIPINIPATINASVDSSVPYSIIEFPLNVNHTWGLSATNITFDGNIKSPWLNKINLLNNFVQRHWWLVELLLKLGYKLQIIPYIDPALLKAVSDILKDILPIINIRHVLTTYAGIEPFLSFPAVPEIFMCTNIENITVQGGTFQAYNISVGGGIAGLYYAPDVGNIVKIYGQFNDIIPFVSNLKAEIIEYNYP